MNVLTIIHEYLQYFNKSSYTYINMNNNTNPHNNLLKLDSNNESNLDSDSNASSEKPDNLLKELETKNISPNIIKELNLDPNKYSNSEYSFESEKWVSPLKFGLENSNQIIPQYYFTSKTKFDYFDYLNIIKDDIRNMRKLNQYQIQYIKKLDHNDKNDIIELFNQVLCTIGDLL